MHVLLHILAQVGTTTTKAKSTKSSGSSVFTLLFFVVVIGAVYLLFMRPRQQRMKQQQAARTQLEVGDQVLTAGGIHGTLVALDDDVAEVEVAPGVVLTFLRRAVSPHPGGRPATEAAAAAQGVDEEWELPAGSDDDAADGRPDEHVEDPAAADHPGSLGASANGTGDAVPPASGTGVDPGRGEPGEPDDPGDPGETGEHPERAS